MNKTALITGACGGIGSEICRALARDGYNIAVHFSSSEEKARRLCEELKTEYGVKAEPFYADLSIAEGAERLAREVSDFFGGADILINNAGVAYQSLFQLADENKIRELFEVNIMSAMSVAQKLLGEMINKKWGRIINISSMWGICGASCEVHYSASKAALIGFTKALAKEVGPSGITVNCIAPGFIDTKMNASLSQDSVKEIIDATPVSRAGTPKDVAALACFLCREEASFITGQIISVDGGFAL